MADKNIQMTQRNATNDGWDNLYPKTKAINVINSGGQDLESHLTNFEIQQKYNANLVPNSTGQFGSKDWEIGGGWIPQDSIAWGDGSYYSYFVNDITPTGNYNDLKTAPIQIGNSIMTLSFEYFFHGITTGGLVYYIVNDATGMDIGVSVGLPLTTQDQWVKVTKTFTVSEMNIRALFRKLINTNGSMRIKNVKLEVGDTATKYSQETDIKSLFQYANNGKTSIANVIGEVSPSSTFAQISDYIQGRKDQFATNLQSKGISGASGSGRLTDLIWQVSQIHGINTSVAGDSLVYSTIFPVDNDYNSEYQLHYTKTVYVEGSYRLRFDIDNIYLYFHINGVNYGGYDFTGKYYGFVVIDVPFNKGDVIQIYAKRTGTTTGHLTLTASISENPFIR